MKVNRNGLQMLLAVLLLGFATSASAALVTISSDEIWDGVANPHAADGVTLAAGVYTIPDGMTINSGTTLFLNASRFEQGATPTGSVTFDFTGAGDLTFADATSTIDIHNGDRFGPTTTFTLNMQGNDILGNGQLINGAVVAGETGKAMFVDINSSANVSLGKIDTSKKDASLAHIDISAEGSVNVGSLSTFDNNAGGASAGFVIIKGQSITLGDIDTTAGRTDGNADNGNIFLTALNPPTFDPSNAVGNDALVNIITLNGTINSNGPATSGPNVGGDLTMTAVKVLLDTGFSLDLGENATSSIDAGIVGGGFSAGDLFMDVAGSGLSANHTVEHFVVPEPSTLMLVICSGLILVGRRKY